MANYAITHNGAAFTPDGKCADAKIYRIFVDDAPMYSSNNAPDAKERTAGMAALYAKMNPKSVIRIEEIGGI